MAKQRRSRSSSRQRHSSNSGGGTNGGTHNHCDSHKRGRGAQCCRRFTAFLFSHVGLCALVVGYAVLGAFAFRALEAPHEVQRADEVQRLRDATVDRLWEITDRYNVLYRENWTVEVGREMAEFQRGLIEAVKDGYDGRPSGQGQRWTLSGAFLYSLTVITTIGYGDIAPRTQLGKIVTMLYAIIGIPLMLLYLTNVGDILAKAFRYTYGKLCSCCRASPVKSPPGTGSLSLAQNTLARMNSQNSYSSYRMVQQSPQLAKHNSPLNHYSVDPPEKVGGSVRQQTQTTQILDFNQTPHDTVAAQHFDDMTPDELGGNNRQASHGGVSGGPMLPSMDNAGPKFDNGPVGLYTSRGFQPVPPSYPIGPSLGLAGFEGSRGREEERIAVPIPLCVLIMVAYISGGAVLFSLWEDWGFLEGAYFCFVTLSTIGFGDFVPGVSDTGSQEKLVICSLYLLAGMVLIAMCFSLMQEEVIYKVRNCGKRIGLIRNSDSGMGLGSCPLQDFYPPPLPPSLSRHHHHHQQQQQQQNMIGLGMVDPQELTGLTAGMALNVSGDGIDDNRVVSPHNDYSW
ncbi:uncharacterized protein LOC111267064 isoform X2 [Varroa jacobsoni]|uniref:uncharacterized protein LOC111267064 isoform X2 n=1 Tax=Varroa jacobsoni TaxID=62625 RepID=UPI000BF8E0A6|nr:uncharacterized protein LOC111267064 isoform X2 [Varroa jacobsoni]